MVARVNGPSVISFHSGASPSLWIPMWKVREHKKWPDSLKWEGHYPTWALQLWLPSLKTSKTVGCQQSLERKRSKKLEAWPFHKQKAPLALWCSPSMPSPKMGKQLPLTSCHLWFSFPMPTASQVACTIYWKKVSREAMHNGFKVEVDPLQRWADTRECTWWCSKKNPCYVLQLAWTGRSPIAARAVLVSLAGTEIKCCEWLGWWPVPVNRCYLEAPVSGVSPQSAGWCVPQICRGYIAVLQLWNWCHPAGWLGPQEYVWV